MSFFDVNEFRRACVHWLVDGASLKCIIDRGEVKTQSHYVQFDGLAVVYASPMISTLSEHHRFKNLRKGIKRDAVIDEFLYLVNGVLVNNVTWMVVPDEPRLLRGLRKLGGTVIDTKVNENADAMVSADDLRWFGVRPLYKFCATIPSLHINPNPNGLFGKAVRSCGYRAVTQRGDPITVVGATYEDIYTQRDLGKYHKNVGMPGLLPYSLSDDFKTMGLCSKECVKEFQSMGQLKLSAVDHPIIALGHPVLAIGGSPGSHFLKLKMKNQPIIVVDPREPARGLEWMKVEVDASFDPSEIMKGEYSVIMDIRRDRDAVGRRNAIQLERADIVEFCGEDDPDEKTYMPLSRNQIYRECGDDDFGVTYTNRQRPLIEVIYGGGSISFVDANPTLAISDVHILGCSNDLSSKDNQVSSKQMHSAINKALTMPGLPILCTSTSLIPDSIVLIDEDLHKLNLSGADEEKSDWQDILRKRKELFEKSAKYKIPVFSNISDAVFRTKHHNDDWNRSIFYDNYVMESIFLKCARHINCKAVSLKFHPAGDDIRARGDASWYYYQPYSSSWTHETRMIVIFDKENKRAAVDDFWELSFDKYVYMVQNYNHDFDDEQKHRLAELAIERKRFKGDEKTNVFSAFAVSNYSNDRNLVFESLKSPFRVMHIIPREMIVKLKDANVILNRLKGPKRNRTYYNLVQNDFRDHLYHPQEFGEFYVYKLSDLLMFGWHHSIPMAGTEARGVNQYLWFAVSNFNLFTDYQDYLNSQTMFARQSSAFYRILGGFDRLQMHEVRRFAVQMVGGDISDSSIDGKIDGIKVDVAGHIVNILLWSEIDTVCIHRYLITIESNVAVSNPRSNARKAFKKIIKTIQMAEMNLAKPYKLWHTYDEYVLGIMSYLILQSPNKKGMNYRAVSQLLKGLKRISFMYPYFKVGKTIKKFIQSF
jgi:hypothetical protein